MLKAVTEEQKNFVLDKFLEYGEITDDGETLILYMEDDYYSIWLPFDKMAKIVDYLREQNNK